MYSTLRLIESVQSPDIPFSEHAHDGLSIPVPLREEVVPCSDQNGKSRHPQPGILQQTGRFLGGQRVLKMSIGLHRVRCWQVYQRSELFAPRAIDVHQCFVLITREKNCILSIVT